MNRSTLRTIASILLFVTAIHAWAEDPLSRRLRVRGDNLYRGSSLTTLRTIETPGLFAPGTTEEEWVKTFARVSECGATGVWFNFEGFNADGTTIDAEYVDGLRRVKGECIYRTIVPVCRLFGSFQPGTLETRLAALRTFAKTFSDDHAMMIAIDGPFAKPLAAELTRLAPKLVVLAPEGGHIALVNSQAEAPEEGPAFVWGAIPKPITSPLHCAMPGDDATYAAFETASRDPQELRPWTPGTHGLTEEEIEQGFVSLFDGQSFDGWVITGRNQNGWTINDGVIEFVTRGGGVIRSRNRYDNFILRLEWKLFQEGANSGVFVRAPRTNRASKMGMEFQLMGDHGEDVGIHTTGAIYSVLAAKTNASNPVGEWNTVELQLEGPRFKATLNGTLVQDINLDDLPELRHRLRNGFIALQDHSSKVAFRNIRLKEL